MINLVDVQVDIMKTPNVNVQSVTTNVLNVLNMNNVMFVLKTDHNMEFHLALAHLVHMTIIMPNVQIVHTCVKLAKKEESVKIVISQELMLLNAIVPKDIMNKLKFVTDVLINVPLVLLKNIVSLVLKTELVPQTVIAQLVNLITNNKIQNVTIVMFNVKLVPVLPIIVTNVTETEKTHMFVIVHQVI